MPETIAAEPVAATTPGPRLSLRWLAAAALVLALLWGGWWLYQVLLGPNLHVVVPGKVYRGSQPKPGDLDRLVARYGIRTIVNLRGCCDPLPWYLDEARASQRLGLSQEDVAFSAIHLPSKHEIRNLLDVFDRSEYPIFMHCRHGADRTGLAAAVVLLLDETIPYATARGQLGLGYGHLSVGRTAALDHFFDLYEDWLAKNSTGHSPANFRRWALNEYEGGWCRADVFAVEPVQPPRAGEPLGFRVRIRNTSPYAWDFKPTATAGFHVFFQVWDAEGRGVADGRAGLMAKHVGAGETVETTVVVPPLAKAGRYRLLVDMIEENHCWFFQTGSEPWEGELHVRE
jgi:protein tyrosine phosphatase (PTP) superfamily phosphohydrolase (DUF442 family)